MFSFLQNHPFAVEAFFESSLVLTYAFPKEELQAMIPDYLTLDTWQDKWAFIAIAMVQTKDLRPKGFPVWIGRDFLLIGYRIFVRYKTSAGKRLRGLYILKSETDKRAMSILGDVFTHYHYSLTDISYTINETGVSVFSKKAKIHVKVETSEEARLPVQSPFNNWKEARRFAGPLPFTFSSNANQRKVVIIEGVRENWMPQPVDVLSADVGFLNQVGANKSVLANAFLIRHIPYFWKKGKTDTWKPNLENHLKV